MIFKCYTCGSTDVGLDIGVNPNNHDTIHNQCITDTPDKEEGYCNQCNDVCQVIRDESPEAILPEPNLFDDWKHDRQDIFILSLHDYNDDTKEVKEERKIFYALYRARQYFSRYAENETADNKEHFVQCTIFDCRLSVEARQQFTGEEDFLQNIESKRLHPISRVGIVICDMLDTIVKYLPGYPERKEVQRFRELRLFIDGVISLTEKITKPQAEEEAFKLTMDLYMEALPFSQQKCAEYFLRINYPETDEQPENL